MDARSSFLNTRVTDNTDMPYRKRPVNTEAVFLTPSWPVLFIFCGLLGRQHQCRRHTVHLALFMRPRTITGLSGGGGGKKKMAAVLDAMAMV